MSSKEICAHLTHEPGSWLARAEPAQVSRVVPGKLFYVELPSQETFAFKPDHLAIREQDGSFRAYRGEPFEKIGLDVGKPVKVIGLHEQHYVVIDPHSAPLRGKAYRTVESLANFAKALIPGA
jgi:hypothetical protein